jgi:hypothetical protein
MLNGVGGGHTKITLIEKNLPPCGHTADSFTTIARQYKD